MDQKSVFGIKKPRGASQEKVKSYRSTSFERQFEGYTHHVEIDSSGKKRVIHTYTGMYYQADLSLQALILRRMGYLLLYGLSVAALVLYGSSGYQGPWGGLLVLPEMMLLFLLIWTGVKLVFYITAPRKMTVGEYKSSCTALRDTAKWSAVCWAVNAVMLLLSALLHKQAASLWLLPLAALLAGGASAAGIFLLEKRTRYCVLPNS